MSRKPSVEVVIRELGFLFEGMSEVTLEELGTALRERAAPGRVAGPVDNAPLLNCARAFGNHRNFSSKNEALELLRSELGLRVSENTAWKHFPGFVALHLLEMPDGAARAEALLRRSGLKPPGKRRSTRSSGDARAMEMVEGIVNAEET